MKRDTAILAASFGTTHIDALERSITAAERVIAESFPECPVYRGFLNDIVIQRLKDRYDLRVDSPGEALARIEKDGYRQVVIQPTLLLQGIEYKRLTEEAEKAGIPAAVGRTLLENVRDCRTLASVLMEENPLEEKEALVLLGHGTEAGAHKIYSLLQDVFEEKGYPAFVAAMTGRPSYADVAEKLSGRGMERARLLPLMLVAGDHAKNNMAGEKDSLLSALRRAGIPTETVFRGLGESRRVQALYAERAGEAMKNLVPAYSAYSDQEE